VLRVVQVNLATPGIVKNVPRVNTKVGPPVVTARWVHTKTNSEQPGVNRAPKEHIRIHQVSLNAKVVLVVKNRIPKEKVVHIAARSEPVPIAAWGRNGTVRKLVKTVQWASTVVSRRLRALIVQ